MIKHIVFWKLAEKSDAARKSQNAAEIKTVLEELIHCIPQIKHMEVGENVNKSDAAFDVCLISVFESQEDLDIYQNHEKHIAAVQKIKHYFSDRAVCDFYDYS